MRINFKKDILINPVTYLTLALLAGIFLRFYKLDLQSFWYDELVSTTISSYSNIMVILGYCLKWEVHPPLYYILLHNWMKIFGNSDTAIKMLSAIAGTLSIPAMYFGAKRVFSKNIAFSATIITALSGSAIYYSQEARSYSLLLLFSTISTLLWLDILSKIRDKTITKKELGYYGLSAILTMYLHYYGTALIFFQGLYLIFVAVFYKKQLKKILITGTILLLLFLPWFLLHVLLISSLKGANFGMYKTTISFLIGVFDLIFTKNMLLLIFIPILIGTRSYFKNIVDNFRALKPDSHISALIYIIVTPVIVLFTISMFNPIVFPRYFMIILPASYLLISLMLSLNPVLEGYKCVIYIFISSVIGLNLFLSTILTFEGIYKSYYEPFKQQWRELSQYVAKNYTNNSIIMVEKYPNSYRYYLKKYIKDKNINIKSLKDSELNYFIINQNYNKIFFALEQGFDKNFEIKLQKDCEKYNKKVFAGDIILYECSLRDKL